MLPAAALGAVTALDVRNVVLRRHADGRLESVEWTGRRVTLGRPDAARLHPIHGLVRRGTWVTIGELLVFAEPGGGTAIVVVPSWWRDEDLARLTAALGLTVQEQPPATTGEFARRHPGRHRLPWSLSHPVAYPLGLLLLPIVWLGAFLFLITHM